jgi:hypothetical protein
VQPKDKRASIKIALVLLNPQYIRSWIDNGLIDELIKDDEIEVTIFAPHHVIERISEYMNVEKVLIDSIEPSFASTHLVAMNWIEKRKLSTTFQFALKRTFCTDYKFIVFKRGISDSLKQANKNFKTIFFNVSKKRLVIIYLFKPLRLIRVVLSRRLSAQQCLPEAIVSERFDWLFIPCNAIDEIITDYLSSAKKLSLKTLIAIDNWDNLTSKSVFVEKPDYLSVMGERCIVHAVDIHSIERSQVLPFGLPRFDAYRNGGIGSQKSNLHSTIEILYAGFSLPHAEIAVVNYLWQGLKSRFPTHEIRFVYRPHPIPIPRIDDVKEVVPGVVTTQHGILERTNMPKMDEDYLLSMLNADVVIGAPTTMVFEAMLLDRPCIIDGTSDQFHRTNAASSIRNFTHMRDLLTVTNLPIANDVEEMLKLLVAMIEQKVRFVNYEMSHLYDKKQPTYSAQLKDFLIKMGSDI